MAEHPEADERQCPHCDEMVKSEAVFCPFCSQRLEHINYKLVAIPIIGVIVVGLIGVTWQAVDFAMNPQHKIEYEQQEKRQEAVKAEAAQRAREAALAEVKRRDIRNGIRR